VSVLKIKTREGDAMSRILPLEPPYAPEVAAQLEAMMPAGVAPIALFRTFARNLPMASAMRVWGGYELSRNLSLRMREREIIIDRTCVRCGAEYEWGVHIAYYAERVGLTPEQVHSLTHGGAADPCWTVARERLLIRAVDALCDHHDIDDALWVELRDAFDEAQLLDLIAMCGWYHAISFVARVTRLPHEPGTPRFSEV
jgi:alkylhydroperoxidase family enzyme